jgi:hypothetical protein
MLDRRPELKYSPPAKGALPDLDYLRLNGDLYWLQPYEEITENEHPWDRGSGVSKERLDALIASGRRVGIEFPSAFLTMMGSTELMQRMFLGGDYFCLGPSLVKCNSEDDKNGDGYVIQFLNDQQSSCSWVLYVAPGGYHCVLNASDRVHCLKCDRGPYCGPPIAWEGHPKHQLHEDIPIACERLRVSQDHPSFEAWLAMKYFDGWCAATLDGDRELTKRQTKYLDHFWMKG